MNFKLIDNRKTCVVQHKIKIISETFFLQKREEETRFQYLDLLIMQKEHIQSIQEM